MQTLKDTTKLSLITITVLLLCLFGFYSKWPLAHDQAAFHYMGWAIDQGLLPYKDLMTMNWPGCILLFYVSEHFFSNPILAMKVIDIIFLFTLCFSSIIYLEFFNVRFSLKLLCILSLIASYFSFSWITILGRDHFSFILLFASTIPWALNKSKWHFYLIGGMIAGQGFMTKPILSIFTVFGIILFFELVKNKKITKDSFLRVFAYGIGGILTLTVYAVFLHHQGYLQDFMRWGIEHNTSAYTKPAYESTALVLFSSLAMHLSNHIATFILLLSIIIYMHATTYKNFSLGDKHPHLFCLIILFPSLSSYIMQAKGFDYHLLPFTYSIVIAGILLINVCLSNIENTKVLKLIVPTLCIGTFIYFLFLPYSIDPTTRSILRREYISDYLKDKVKNDNEVLYIGYMPNILYNLKLKTVSPLLDTLCYFFFTPKAHPEYKHLTQNLESALNNKSVKYLIVEHSNLNYLPDTTKNLIRQNYKKVNYSEYYFFNKDSYQIKHKKYGKKHHGLYTKNTS